MRRVFGVVALLFVLLVVGAGTALADEYTVVIDVAGEPMTLTVTADSGLSVADIDVVSVKPVASVASEVVGKQYTVVRSANLRAGPGTSFAVAGSAKIGDVVVVVGGNADGSWHKLDDGSWIAAFLVEAVGVEPIPTPRATSAPTRVPTPTVTPRPSIGVDVLKNDLLDVLGDSNRDVDRLVSVDKSLDVINIEWAIDSGLTDDSIRFGARMDVVAILTALHDSGIEYGMVNINGSFLMVDRLGNKSEDIIVWLTFNRDTVESINWDDRTYVNYSLQKYVFEVADHIKLHPAMQEE